MSEATESRCCTGCDEEIGPDERVYCAEDYDAADRDATVAEHDRAFLIEKLAGIEREASLILGREEKLFVSLDTVRMFRDAAAAALAGIKR